MAVGGALFGSSAGRSTSGPKALVEFKAGKMTLNSSTKMVTPDKRKGLVSVIQSDDQLMHLQWKDRGTGTTEDDLIIFPDDVEFKAVPACTTGRVFVLKFKTSSKRMFFWMQEPKTDKDEEFCKKVNEFLNNPPAPGSRSGSAGGSGGSPGLPQGLDNLDDSQLQSLLNNMSQNQLMQLFGGSLGSSGNVSNLASLLGGAGPGAAGRETGRTRQAAGSTGRVRQPAEAGQTPATPASTTLSSASAAETPASSSAGSAAGQAIKLSDLQSILSTMPVPAGEGSGASLTGEALQPLLSNPQFLEKVKEFLPAEGKEENKELSASDLGSVTSPQFQQAVSMFSMVLKSGKLGPLIREFNLGDDAINAASSGEMEAFVKAIQKKEGGDVKDKPEDMALD